MAGQQINYSKVPTGELHADFCSRRPDILEPTLKIVFLVDQSAGNRLGANGVVGSDVGGERRFLPIIDFLSTVIGEDPTVFISALTFNSSIENSIPLGPSNFPLNSTSTTPGTYFAQNSPPNIGITNWVNQTLAQDKSITPNLPLDQGESDFVMALTNLTNLVQNDMAVSCPNATQKIIYSVMMVSDGFPFLNGTPQATSDVMNALNNYLNVPTQYQNCVQQMLLSTGLYFNPPNAGKWTPPTGDICQDDLTSPGSDLSADINNAKNLMCQMAKAGGGNFNLFPEAINYAEFAQPVRKVKYTVRDVIVKNMSTAWSNGTLVPNKYMSPLATLKDSDNNGVSDLVELSVFGRPCQDAHCNPDDATQFNENICKNIKNSTNSNGSFTYIDTDGDGLNDCEEKLLQSDILKFSTNESWVPDILMFLNNMNLAGLPAELQLDPDLDGLTNYQEIKGSTPPSYPNTLIQGLTPIDYKVRMTAQTSSQECYHVDVSNILVLSPSDTVELFVTDGSQAINVNRTLRTKTIQLNNYEAQISNADFPE